MTLPPRTNTHRTPTRPMLVQEADASADESFRRYVRVWLQQACTCVQRARAATRRSVDWSEDIAGAPCPVSTLSSTAGPHAPYLSRQPRRALRNLSKGACGVGCSGRARVRRGCEPRRVDRPESTSGASPPLFQSSNAAPTTTTVSRATPETIHENPSMLLPSRLVQAPRASRFQFLG